MARASYQQSSFAGGEWSQAAQGNYASPSYRTAMSTCLNGVLLDTGAWGRRPGTKLAGTTRGGAKGRLIRYGLAEAQPYNMEFTDGHLRFWDGLDLVTANDDATVVSVSAANPAVVTVSASTTWATADQGFFDGLGTATPLLQGRLFAITVLTPTTFSLADALTGTAIDGATLGSLVTAPAPKFKRARDIVTPYSANTWSNLRSVQAEKVAVLLNGSVRPQLLQATDATPFETFALTPSFFRDGPYLDPVSGGALATPSGLTGIISLALSFNAYSAATAYTLGDYVTSVGINYKSLADANLANTPASSPTFWVAVQAGDPISSSGFVTTDIGRHVRLYSEPALWDVATAYVAKNIVAYGGTYWTCLVNNTGNAPGNDLINWTLTPANAAIWSWGIITSLGNAISANPAGSVNIGDMTGGGGLAAAFDGTTNQDDTHSASVVRTSVLPAYSLTGSAYIGKNFGPSPQAIGSVALYPSSGSGFFQAHTTGIGGPDDTRITGESVTFNLRAKASAPVNAADGTLLGTTTIAANQATAITIPSSDTTTTWAYVWVEILVTTTSIGFVTCTQTIYAAEMQFLGAAGTGSSAVNVEILGPPLLYTSAVRAWRIGAYSDTTGWPKCGTYHEGRLWLSGAIGNRFDSSMSDDPYVFSPTGPDGTVASNNGITYTFNASDVETIFWMEPDQQGIICGTQGGEWLVQASALNQPLTPTSIQAHRYTRIKCANIAPVRCEHTTVFVQANQRRLMEYFADVYSGKFAAPNLSTSAKHLAATNLLEIAYQQDLQPVIWARTGVGQLIGVSYKRDSLISKDGPTLAAWHQHTLGSARTVESVCVGPSPDGNLENLALVTSDGTTRHVEVMADLFEETDTTGWHLDDGLAPSSYAILPAAGLATKVTLYGLWLLNGKTVDVMCNGLDCGQVVVANGQADVTFGDGVGAGTGGGLFTRAYVEAFGAALAPFQVGFTYTSRGQILRPNSPQESGAREGPAFGKRRRSHKLMAQLVLAAGISFGTVFGKLRPARFTTPGGTKYTPLQLFSGIYVDEPKDDESFDSQPCWEITRPYPAILTSIGALVDTKDQ